MATATLTNPGRTVLKPSSLAHLVLKTSPSQFSAMVSFYQTFLSASIRYSTSNLAFLTYDDEHHRIAIVAIPGIKPRDPNASGLVHFAVTFDSLNDLALGYLQRKENGLVPYWCVNHGPTVSMYYHDPDGHDVEAQVDCYPDPESATEFMMSPEFAENPIGVDYDPEDLVARLKAGESDETIMKRPNIGPRGIPILDN